MLLYSTQIYNAITSVKENIYIIYIIYVLGHSYLNCKYEYTLLGHYFYNN